MNQDVRDYINDNFYNLTNKISNYLFQNNISDTKVFYERKEDGIITFGVKVSKGSDEDLNNYVLFNFTNIDEKINLDVKSTAKNKRPTLILLRYFSNDILKFVIDMEYEIKELDLENKIKLQTNHILHNKRKKW